MSNLRAVLKARGKRQVDIAVACGVGAPTVSRWVKWINSRGECGVPVPARALPVISELTGLPVADLLPRHAAQDAAT